MSRFLTPPPRALGLSFLAALIGAGAVAILLGGCAGSSATQTAQAPTRTRPLETIFEAPPELKANPGTTLDELKRDRIVLVVSHHRQVMERCDRLVVIESGRIAGERTYA